ncbi:MAG: hypothetical protein AAF485_26090, partial [Chloroflexota bacterium]
SSNFRFVNLRNIPSIARQCAAATYTQLKTSPAIKALNHPSALLALLGRPIADEMPQNTINLPSDHSPFQPQGK